MPVVPASGTLYATGMAFTGTATVKQISDRQVRITGLSLDTSASGTIGLFGATGTTPGVTLPQAFQPQVYDYLNSGVSLADSISCSVNFVNTAGTTTPVAVAKTGTTVADFRITLTNPIATTGSGLEIYVRFHD